MGEAIGRGVRGARERPAKEETATDKGGLGSISQSPPPLPEPTQFGGQIIAQRDSSAGLRYMHGDHLGSVAVTNNSSRPCAIIFSQCGNHCGRSNRTSGTVYGNQ